MLIVVAPVVSLIPYTLYSGMSILAKYSIELYFKDAAPKKKVFALSSPRACLILDKTRRFAIEYISD